MKKNFKNTKEIKNLESKNKEKVCLKENEELKSNYKIVFFTKSLLILIMCLQMVIVVAYIVQFVEFFENVKIIAEKANIDFNLNYFFDHLRESNVFSISSAISCINFLINISFFFLEAIGFVLCNKYCENYLEKQVDKE